MELASNLNHLPESIVPDINTQRGKEKMSKRYVCIKICFLIAAIVLLGIHALSVLFREVVKNENDHFWNAVNHTLNTLVLISSQKEK